MRKTIEPKNLSSYLAEHVNDENFVSLLNNLIHFLRQGGHKGASERFQLLLNAFTELPDTTTMFSNRFHTWLTQIHLYPAFIGLGIFSRSGFAREMSIRLYERISPSYRDLNNLRDIFLYFFRSSNDEKWLQTISIRQWISFYTLLNNYCDSQIFQTASKKISADRLQAIEMLSIWVAAEAVEPDFIRIDPKLMQVNSAFVALQHEVNSFVCHYRQFDQTELYDTAHLEVMLEQCETQVNHLRRKGTGAGAGSSIKTAHLLERLNQTLERIRLLIDIQTKGDTRYTITLLQSMTMAAVEQHSTEMLRKRSIKMLALSISENTGGHGDHYITRNKREYFRMFGSAAGGGVLIALMALHKIHISTLNLGEFTTALFNGLNYGLGFMLIYMLHFTVATKQPAMTASTFAEAVSRNDNGRAMNTKLAKLAIDVARSQNIAIIGNVSVAIIVATLIATWYQQHYHEPLLDAAQIAYQNKSVNPITQPTLIYAAIAGVWLFCSGIISGFFDNRANYLNLRQRIPVNPFIQKILPLRARIRLGEYLHIHYGSLMGNFIFGMLLGMTSWFGFLIGMPLDIRHVAFSSANIGYAADGLAIFLFNLMGVLLIGAVNLWVSFSLALSVALSSRDAKINSLSLLLKSIKQEFLANPINLFFPFQPSKTTVSPPTKDEK